VYIICTQYREQRVTANRAFSLQFPYKEETLLFHCGSVIFLTNVTLTRTVAVPKTHNTENTIAIRILQNQARMVHAPCFTKPFCAFTFLYFTEYNYDKSNRNPSVVVNLAMQALGRASTTSTPIKKIFKAF